MCLRRPSCSRAPSSPPGCAHQRSPGAQGRQKLSFPKVASLPVREAVSHFESLSPHLALLRTGGRDRPHSSKQKTLQTHTWLLPLASPKARRKLSNLAPQVSPPPPASPACRSGPSRPPTPAPGRGHNSLALSGAWTQGKCLSALPSPELILTRSSCEPELL